MTPPGSEVVELLSELIRCDTSNPPGNERAAVDLIAERLEAEGVPFEVVEPAPRRANLVARLKGKGGKPPLLLSAHLDVVPALGGWDHPPFGGEIHDGFVWGRGAVDMKHMAAMSVVALLELKRRGIPLERDLIFAAVADEEAGGYWGAGWLVENRPELIQAEYCLTELGGMTVEVGGKVVVPVQVAQKGYVWFKLIARGPAGHGSRPVRGTAIEKLCAAVERLCAGPLRYGLCPTSRAFVTALAQAQRGAAKAAMKGLLSKATARLSLKLLPPERRPVFEAMLHDTAAVTALSAGVKVNVVPNVAEAQVDGRYLPGTTEEQFLAEVRALVGPGIEVERFDGAPPLEMAPESELWDAIQAVVERNCPGGKAVPYMIPGMTDAKDYDRIGIKTYGFAPVALKPGEPFAELYHAPNERVPVEGLETGSRWLYELTRDFCAG